MIHNLHSLLGAAAVAIGLVGYYPYYRDILARATRPHPFTWIGISLLNGITYAAQVVTGAGPGAWVSGITAIASFGIAVLALRQGEKRITSFDWICFIGAISSLIVWRLTHDPLGAVVAVTLTDLLVLAPTVRKTYLRPYEETATLYAVGVVKYGLSLFALSSFTLTTALFPSVIAAANLTITIMILFRRYTFATVRAVDR